jgi:CubicO group peptidase (beta-lactamase class C family)
VAEVIDTQIAALPLRDAAVSDMFASLARKHRVPGAQLAFHYLGKTVAVEVGELEVGTGHRVTRSAAFPIGSVSKSFTATLVMILVADGDLELDAPVSEYLPELSDLGDDLTVRSVLSHTSGLAADPRSEDEGASSLRRYVTDHCRPQNLIQPPGVDFSYSNMGYILAGRLIEACTGMSWWDAMESILLRPLGIDPAFVGAHRPSRRRVATGHSVNTVVGRVRPAQQACTPAEAPAGGLAVSAMDLVSLGLLHGDPGVPALLPAGHAELMRRPVPGAEPYGLADGWGLGLAVFRSGGAEWVGHDGNGDGTACYFRVDPVGGCAVALTSNSNTGYGMWRELLDELSRAGIPIEPYHARTSRRPMHAPLACAGTYLNGDVEYKVTVAADGRLQLVADGEPFGRVTCHDDLTFLVRDPAAPEQEVIGRFRRDRYTGMIDGLQIGGRLARRPAHATRTSARRLTA